MAARTDWVRRDGIALRVEVSGGDVSPALVLLHGLGDDRRLWDGVRERLPGALRIVTCDLRGHGESDAPEDPGAYTMRACVDDLRAILDQQALERVLVVGFSLGGAVALHFALAAPERVVAVAAINANAAARDVEEEAALAAAARTGEGTAALPSSAERRFFSRVVARLSEGARRAAAIGRGASIVERAHELELPVWLIASDRDPGFARRSAALVARLPAGRRHVIAGAGHAIMLDRPDELAAVLAEFARQAPIEDRRARRS